MKTSPTQRTLARLRAFGYTAQVVEYWNSFARRRVDLFGCVDIVAAGGGTVLFIQTTDGTSHSARIEKAKSLPAIAALIDNGGAFHVWSWGKRGARGKVKSWTLRAERVDISPAGSWLIEDVSHLFGEAA